MQAMREVACELRYGGIADAFLLVAVAATLALVMLVPFPTEARMAIVGWALLGAAHARAKLAGTRRLRIDCDGAVEVHIRGRVVQGRLAAGSFVAPWLTIVRWRHRGAWLASTLVLLPGAASPGTLRAIRVILRAA
jgi:toxin CptA